MIFEDENYTYHDRSKSSHQRSQENNFINELNRARDHKKLRADDLVLSKSKALLALQAEKLHPEKNATAMGSTNLNFTQTIAEILTNFAGPNNFEKLMPADAVVSKLKQLQLNTIRKYILEFIKQHRGDKALGKSKIGMYWF